MPRTMRINGLYAAGLTRFSSRYDLRRSFLAYCGRSSRSLSHRAHRPALPTVRTAVPSPETRRSARTKQSVKLQDLPQGALKLEPYDDGVDDTPRYPAVLQGHRNNMQKFKNCIVLTRIGGFYEVRIGLGIFCSIIGITENTNIRLS